MAGSNSDDFSNATTVRLAVDVVAAYLGQNALPAAQIPDVLRSVYTSLAGLGEPARAAEPEAQKPAVPVKKSVTADYIVCLEDGKKLKMLKRHLRTTYNMSPEDYRAKWNLPADYPMVAPTYAATRSEFAKKIGLGRKPGAAAAKRGRRRKSA